MHKQVFPTAPSPTTTTWWQYISYVIYLICHIFHMSYIIYVIYVLYQWYNIIRHISYAVCHKCHMAYVIQLLKKANLSWECAMRRYLDRFVVIQFSGLKPFDVVIPACPSHPDYIWKTIKLLILSSSLFIIQIIHYLRNWTIEPLYKHNILC